MPIFTVNTNVAKCHVPATLLCEVTKDLPKAMGKPEEYMAVHVKSDEKITFGGKGDPCALCSLHSIGKLSTAENKQYSKLLSGMLKKHLGIPPERIYIIFVDVAADKWGWNNSTFDDVDISGYI